MRYVFSGLLWLVIAVHMLVIFGIVTSFFILPFRVDWFVALPLMVFIVYLTFTRVDCPLTNLENVLRRRLGKNRIGGFVGTYYIKPVKKLLKRRKC
jgi:hypothetical protein